MLFAIGSAAIGSQLVVTPGPSSSAEPSASAEPSFAPSAQPSPTNPAEQIGPGTLAVVIEAAGVLDEPSGSYPTRVMRIATFVFSTAKSRRARSDYTHV